MRAKPLIEFGFVLDFSGRGFDCDFEIAPLFPVTLNFVPFAVRLIHGVNPIFRSPFAEHSILAPPFLAENFKIFSALFRLVVKVTPIPVLVPKPTPFAAHSRAEQFKVTEIDLPVLGLAVLVDEILQRGELLARVFTKGNLGGVLHLLAVPIAVTELNGVVGNIEGSPSLDFLLCVDMFFHLTDNLFQVIEGGELVGKDGRIVPLMTEPDLVAIVLCSLPAVFHTDKKVSHLHTGSIAVGVLLVPLFDAGDFFLDCVENLLAEGFPCLGVHSDFLVGYTNLNAKPVPNLALAMRTTSSSFIYPHKKKAHPGEWHPRGVRL